MPAKKRVVRHADITKIGLRTIIDKHANPMRVSGTRKPGRRKPGEWVQVKRQEESTTVPNTSLFEVDGVTSGIGLNSVLGERKKMFVRKSEVRKTDTVLAKGIYHRAFGKFSQDTRNKKRDKKKKTTKKKKPSGDGRTGYRSIQDGKMK